MASISENEASATDRLRYKWVFWSRLPQTSKAVDYEKGLRTMVSCETPDEFVVCYRHLNLPSALPAGTDYAFFKDGIRPMWEDPANKDGGKWVIRVRKGVSDKYWQDILLSLVGNIDWIESGEDVCGVVLSVRKEEDILSLWTRTKEHNAKKMRYVVSLSHFLVLLGC
jgi:translation initiation factor 4E